MSAKEQMELAIAPLTKMLDDLKAQVDAVGAALDANKEVFASASDELRAEVERAMAPVVQLAQRIRQAGQANQSRPSSAGPIASKGPQQS